MGNEGDGSHEGHEGHEEEKCQQNCQVRRLSWVQREDHRWLDQERFGGEQAWQDCEQEKCGSWEKGLRPHQGLDYSSPEGKEGTSCEGLCCCQEGHCSLQAGQGALPVNILYVHEHARASAQGVGMSTPF